MKRLFQILLLSHVAWAYGQKNEFYAYHTKVVHSSTDYMGKYADLIVVIGDSQLEFTRRTQYLPKWVTPAGSYMVDDFFPGRDPDHEFNHNYVRLIEENEELVKVHWRYFPDLQTIQKANDDLNPTHIEGFLAAVHEIFTIYKDGKIERKVMDSRGSDYRSWDRQNFADQQLIQLEKDGVKHGSVRWGNRDRELASYVEMNPLRTHPVEDPILWWTFDEGGGSYPKQISEDINDLIRWEPDKIIQNTFEIVNGTNQKISGHDAFYTSGISGTALGFDGFYSGITLPRLVSEFGSTYYRDDGIPKFDQTITIEAWIAPDSYPYNTAPIVHQSKNFGDEGFYFGLNEHGKLIFTVNGSTVKSDNPIPYGIWSHVTAVYDGASVNIFINGELVGQAEAQGSLQNSKYDFTIGMNSERLSVSDFVRSPMQNIPFLSGFTGLIDELRVYNRTLSTEEIKNIYQSMVPDDTKSLMKTGVLPGEIGIGDDFGAVYKNLEFQDLWDRMWRLPEVGSDIVVKFEDNPASLIYWHGTNFAANWVVDNNRWMADQSSEIFTKHGCSEHMADKQTRYSYARIIEQNPARVKIHWRYPNVDVGYVCTNRRNWSDEYHTIYPDGTAVRQVVYNNSNAPGFQDIQFFTNPGETALDVVNLNAMTVANTEGETLELQWELPNKNPAQTLTDATIEWINSKSEWKVYTIFQGPGISTWGEFEQSSYTEDPFAGPWNHWPVSLTPSDGRYATAHDKVTHFALGANDNAPEHMGLVHYGFTKEGVEKLIPMARYWQNPPEVADVNGGRFLGFDKPEKAFYFIADDEVMDFRIKASSEQPLINPAFVVEGKTTVKELKIDGKNYSNYKEGISRSSNGEAMMVIWMEYKGEKTSVISIK